MLCSLLSPTTQSKRLRSQTRSTNLFCKELYKTECYWTPLRRHMSTILLITKFVLLSSQLRHSWSQVATFMLTFRQGTSFKI
ncbi:hypothetical protein Plhal304r1_c003g0010581 [Plasmopara halstedii]